MSKLAKSTYLPFTGAQPPLPQRRPHRPQSRRRHYLFKTHERVNWSLTELLGHPLTAIDVDALTPADIFVAETALLVDANSPDYVANLIEYFKADQDICDFIMDVGIEEWKHYYVLADYITKVRTALAARAAGGGDVSLLIASVREGSAMTSLMCARPERRTGVSRRTTCRRNSSRARRCRSSSRPSRSTGTTSIHQTEPKLARAPRCCWRRTRCATRCSTRSA